MTLMEEDFEPDELEESGPFFGRTLTGCKNVAMYREHALNLVMDLKEWISCYGTESVLFALADALIMCAAEHGKDDPASHYAADCVREADIVAKLAAQFTAETVAHLDGMNPRRTA